MHRLTLYLSFNITNKLDWKLYNFARNILD